MYSNGSWSILTAEGAVLYLFGKNLSGILVTNSVKPMPYHINISRNSYENAQEVLRSPNNNKKNNTLHVQ